MDIIEQRTRAKLAAVYRLIHHYGWDDLIFTHCSAKIPNTNYLLINNYGLRFDEITASNLLKIDFDGNVINGNGAVNQAGLVIHSEIHRSKPNIDCVIHTHSVHGVAVSCDKDGLLNTNQRTALIHLSLAYHDYHGIVVDDYEREILRQSIGNKKNIILRNHGLMTLGDSIDEAWLRIHELEVACKVQTLLDKTNCSYISDEVMSKIDRQAMETFKTAGDPYTVAWRASENLVRKYYPDYSK
jgi:ribulose-5-phosphate 4-epimerase/fuculose-1-phosphate aldolase